MVVLRVDSVQTILPGVIFRRVPEPLNEVQLTVELRVENHRMTSRFHLLLKFPRFEPENLAVTSSG